MKTGIELISEERQKQIDKHGFTAEHHANHPEWYAESQLIDASRLLSYNDIDDIFRPTAIDFKLHPNNWDEEWFIRLMNKPYKERLIIAAALITSELDRLNYLEINDENRDKTLVD